jgi:2-pyrone-4,6-dicarboxylate lactonase
VQSAVHGTDNRAVEDAIAAGQGRYLGVALVPPDVADAELPGWPRPASAACASTSCATWPAPSIDEVVALTPRLAAPACTCRCTSNPALVHELAEAAGAQRGAGGHRPHGTRRCGLGPDHPDFRALVDLLRNPLFRVKVSGIDRIDSSPASAPSYPHGVELARRLVEAFPDRCFWGTDWPHPNHTHVPDDAALVDALERIAPTPAAREQLLVDQSRHFYRFAPHDRFRLARLAAPPGRQGRARHRRRFGRPRLGQRPGHGLPLRGGGRAGDGRRPRAGAHGRDGAAHRRAGGVFEGIACDVTSSGSVARWWRAASSASAAWTCW